MKKALLAAAALFLTTGAYAAEKPYNPCRSIDGDAIACMKSTGNDLDKWFADTFKQPQFLPQALNGTTTANKAFPKSLPDGTLIDVNFLKKAYRFGDIVEWTKQVFSSRHQWYNYSFINGMSLSWAQINNARDAAADLKIGAQCSYLGRFYEGVTHPLEKQYWIASCLAEQLTGDVSHPNSMSDVETCYIKKAWDIDKTAPDDMTLEDRLTRVKAATAKCDTVQSKKVIAAYFKKFTKGGADSDTIYVTVDWNF